jgi:hypothetical protein
MMVLQDQSDQLLHPLQAFDHLQFHRDLHHWIKKVRIFNYFTSIVGHMMRFVFRTRSDNVTCEYIARWQEIVCT